MRRDKFQNSLRRLRTPAVLAFSKARTLEKVIEGACTVSAFFIAARITGTMGLFRGFFNQHEPAILHTLLVSMVFYPLLSVIADMALVFFRELFASNSADPKLPDHVR